MKFKDKSLSFRLSRTRYKDGSVSISHQTAAMIKAGAKQAATGENPVIVACRRADVIIGPVGIVIADSLLGEVTPAMALAVGQSDAVRSLIPMNKCQNIIVGTTAMNTASLISEAMAKLRLVLDAKNA